VNQAQFKCVNCGCEGHADVVGAINILARGHRVLACGEAVSRAKVAKPKRAASKKQEPIEATVREVSHAQHRRNPPPSRASGGRRPRWGRMSIRSINRRCRLILLHGSPQSSTRERTDPFHARQILSRLCPLAA
jgi:hypothetical protein